MTYTLVFAYVLRVSYQVMSCVINPKVCLLTQATIVLTADIPLALCERDISTPDQLLESHFITLFSISFQSISTKSSSSTPLLNLP